MNIEHPAISRILETGYPFDTGLDEDEIWGEFQEDTAFEERREAQLFESYDYLL